jgi:hypothetical protein
MEAEAGQRANRRSADERGYFTGGIHTINPANQFVYIQDTDGNLWLTQGPSAPGSPGLIQVDGNVDPDASFQALDDNLVFVCGSDGNLWLERGPFGTVPLPESSVPFNPASSRYRIDGSVGAFGPVGNGEVAFVLGQDGNLWFEHDFGNGVPPPRDQVDGNVHIYGNLGSTEVFVLGENGNLWQTLAPFGPPVPLPPCRGANEGCRNLVDANVKFFFPFEFYYPSRAVYVVGTDGILWLETGSPFGNQLPPVRVPVDENVIDMWPVDDQNVYVLDIAQTLWFEHGPFGKLPWVPCPTLSGGCRELVAQGVAAFGYFPDAGGIWVIDGTTGLSLSQYGYPSYGGMPLVEFFTESVIAFQPLSPSQVAPQAQRRASRTVRVPRRYLA